MIAFAIAESVAGAGVNVKLDRDAGFLEQDINIGQALGNIGTIIRAAEKKRGRRILGGNDSFSSSRIDQGLKIRFAAQAIHRVSSVGNTVVKMHARQGGEFASSGKAHDSHARRVDLPLLRAAAHQADGALHVGNGVSIHGVGGIFFAGETVFQDETGDAVLAEPLSDVQPLMVERQEGVPAAGRDDDRGAGGLFF